jgi:hypothetical protein
LQTSLKILISRPLASHAQGAENAKESKKKEILSVFFFAAFAPLREKRP